MHKIQLSLKGKLSKNIFDPVIFSHELSIHQCWISGRFRKENFMNFTGKWHQKDFCDDNATRNTQICIFRLFVRLSLDHLFPNDYTETYY